MTVFPPIVTLLTKVRYNNIYFIFSQDVFEIQKDSITPEQKVVIVDDLLATGGRPYFCSVNLKFCVSLLECDSLNYQSFYSVVLLLNMTKKHVKEYDWLNFKMRYAKASTP